MADNANIVLEAFKKADKPLRPGEAADLCGLNKDEVTKLIKNLKKQGLLISPKRCFYAPAAN